MSKDLKTTSIVGIKFRPAEVKTLLRSFSPNTPIFLQRDPENKYDRFAVKVMTHTSNGDVFCGFIPAVLSQIFATLIANNVPLDARVFDVRTGDTGYPEVDIIISLA